VPRIAGQSRRRKSLDVLRDYVHLGYV